jgi:hypothetical protein
MKYSDITILQYQRLISATRHHTDNAFEIGIELLNIFENIPRTESEGWDIPTFNKRLERYSFLNQEMPSDKWVKSFELSGITYKVMQTPNKWNVGQYVSMSNLTKDQSTILDNLHTILAVMCVGKDKMDVQDRAEHFQNNLSIEVAYPIALFFLGVLLMLPEHMMDSLRGKVSQVGLELSGVGMM